jgi:hypothetical protein
MIQETPVTIVTHQETLTTIIGFIRSIGITIEEGLVAPGSFLPDIEIKNGGIIYDPEKLAHPGDLLHEAGHIAVSIPSERPTLSGNITEADSKKMGDELAVLLWTWAASLHLQLPPQVVFHPEGYRGDSEWLIQQFSTGKYIGLPLIIWMKLAKDPNEENGFPRMLRWMREE